MKKVSILTLAVMAIALSLTPDWKSDLHAQAGSYTLDGNYKGSSIKDDQNVQ